MIHRKKYSLNLFIKLFTNWNALLLILKIMSNKNIITDIIKAMDSLMDTTIITQHYLYKDV